MAARRRDVAWFGCTIYDHPSDFPGHFVVRRWRIDGGHGAPIMDPIACLCDSIVQARGTARICLGHVGTCLGRHPSDDPVIVESYV